MRTCLPEEPPAGEPDHEATRMGETLRLFHGASEDEIALACAVQRAVDRIPVLDDHASFLLNGKAHEPPDAGVLARVELALPAEPDEDQVICDFTASCPGPLDARDEHLRRGATDFGVFVAECVRREGRADIALLNAGTFRCDAELPRVLQLRDLRDTFLYDGKRAVVVLTLERRAVEAALRHGKGQSGNGGYPQFAPLEVPPGERLRVAIASFLVVGEKGGDGYHTVIASELGTTTDALREMARQASTAFSIKGAVTAHARQVGYCPVDRPDGASDVVSEFIRHADRLVRAMKLEFDSQEFRKMLGSDGPLADRALQEVRDALRAVVRAIPEVQEAQRLLERYDAEELKQPQDEDSLVAAEQRAFERLQALHEELRQSVEKFRNGVDYHTLLNFVAAGIGGWQS
jgi:hypothetical protein